MHHSKFNQIYFTVYSFYKIYKWNGSLKLLTKKNNEYFFLSNICLAFEALTSDYKDVLRSHRVKDFFCSDLFWLLMQKKENISTLKNLKFCLAKNVFLIFTSSYSKRKLDSLELYYYIISFYMHISISIIYVIRDILLQWLEWIQYIT